MKIPDIVIGNFSALFLICWKGKKNTRKKENNKWV